MRSAVCTFMNEAIGLQLQQVERKYKLNTPVNKGKLHVNTEPYSFRKIPDLPGNLIRLYTLISFSRFLQLYLFNLRFLLMFYFLFWAVSFFIIIYLFIYIYFALLLLSQKFQEFNKIKSLFIVLLGKILQRLII